MAQQRMDEQVVNPLNNPLPVRATPTPVRTTNTSSRSSNVSMVGGGGTMQVYKPDFGALQANMDAILKNYEDYRKVVGDQYDTSKQSLDTGLANSTEDIQESKQDNKNAFGDARGVIAEDAFNRERGLQAQMSARGLSGSGIEQLGGIQNRMATGKAVSETSKGFFENQAELSKQMVRTQETYNTSLQQLNNSLQSALTQIMSDENASRSDYTQMVQALERQVISDTNSALEAQRQWQLSTASYNLQAKQYNDAKNAEPTPYEIQQIVESDQSTTLRQKALESLGYSSKDAKRMIEEGDFTRKLTNENTSVSALQTQVDNMVRAGTKPKDIEAMLRTQAQAGTYNFDISRIKINGKPVGLQNQVNSYSANNYTGGERVQVYGTDNLADDQAQVDYWNTR